MCDIQPAFFGFNLALMRSSQEKPTNHCRAVSPPNTQSDVRQVNWAWHLVRQPPPQSGATGDSVGGGNVYVCFLNTFRAQGAPGWARAVCSLCSVCLLSHGWLRAIKSKCVSVIFLLRWEFRSLPSDGQCGSFVLHTCELAANCFEINQTSFHTNPSSMLCWTVEALLPWVNPHRSTGILYFGVFCILFFWLMYVRGCPFPIILKFFVSILRQSERGRLKTMRQATKSYF